MSTTIRRFADDTYPRETLRPLTEQEISDDVFLPGGLIQTAIESLLAKKARREPLTADQEGILAWMFGRPGESGQRNEIARVASVLEHQAAYVAARDALDQAAMQRAANSLRHLAPQWVKSPFGHPLATEEAAARRELGQKTIRRDTLRSVCSRCHVEPRGTESGGVEQVKLPPLESDPTIINFCRREYQPGDPAFPRERSNGGLSTYWVDLSGWMSACCELSAEADRLDREIPEAEARLAEISAAHAELNRSRAEIYIPS